MFFVALQYSTNLY